jgi:hypothetical protein
VADLNTAQVSDTLLQLPLASAATAPAFDSVLLRHATPGGTWANHNAQFSHTDALLTARGTFLESYYNFDFYYRGRLVDSYYLEGAQNKPNGESVVTDAELELTEDGVLFHAYGKHANWIIAEVVTDVGSDRYTLARREPGRFSLFYRPDTSVSLIDHVIFRGPVGFRPDTLSAQVHYVIDGIENVAHLKPGIALRFDPVDLFDKVLLHVRDTVVDTPPGAYYSRKPFILESSAAAFAGWADLYSGVPPDDDQSKLGLYVLHEKKGWLWAGGRFDSTEGYLISDLGGPGVLAIIADTTAPKLYGFNLDEGEVIASSRPYITFTVDDNLSDFEDDRNFNVTLDNKWLVPEFDPERKTFKTRPDWRLYPGIHKLSIEVADRCGNTTRETRSFTIHTGLKGKTTY